MRLSSEDISSIRKSIEETIVIKINSYNNSRDGYSLSADFLQNIINDVVFQMLLSLCGAYLYDWIMEKANKKQTSKSKREYIIQIFVGKKINIERSLNPTCKEEIKKVLTPLGFTEEEIDGIYI